MPFDWLHPKRVAPAGRDAMYRREIEDRAALLYRLGYPKAEARSRLAANVAWDFEVGAGEPPTSQQIDEAIEAIYHRGGRSSGSPTV